MLNAVLLASMTTLAPLQEAKGEARAAHSVQEIALPEVSRPAEKNMPNSPASSASGSGCPVAGSRRRSRCAAMLTSSMRSSPLAFTCARRRRSALWVPLKPSLHRCL